MAPVLEAPPAPDTARGYLNNARQCLQSAADLDEYGGVGSRPLCCATEELWVELVCRARIMLAYALVEQCKK